MKILALSHFPMTWLTCAALLLFFGAFVGAFAQVFSKGNIEHFRRAERLPISEEGNRHEQ